MRFNTAIAVTLSSLAIMARECYTFTTTPTTLSLRYKIRQTEKLDPEKSRANNIIKLFVQRDLPSLSIEDEKLIAEYPDDYLITDSAYLQSSSRPSLLKALANPRDLAALPTILVGFAISILNIKGIYNEQYQQLEIIAISLGFLSTFAYIIQLATGFNISKNIRRGVVDDATVTIYAAAYTGAVSWLALRTCNLCPSWLYLFDSLFPFMSVLVFVLSLVTPALTLFSGDDSTSTIQSVVILGRKFTGSVQRGQQLDIPAGSAPSLSPTELLRARGLFAIGVLACVFAPDALSFALGGQEWWDRVYQMHPSQRYLESSTALFALFSVEASMISHRVGKTGAACYREIVPIFAIVCLILAIFPCVCALNWLGDDISFFSFYRE